MSSGIPLIICSVLATVAFGALVTFCCLQIRQATVGASLLTCAERLRQEREQRSAWMNPHARPLADARQSGRRSGHGQLGG